MKEKNKHIGLIILIVVLVILFVPIVMDYIAKQNIKTISLDDLNEKILNKETFILYNGDVSKDLKKELRSIKSSSSSKSDDYSYEYEIYSINSDELEDDVKFSMYIDGDIQKTYTKEDTEALSEDIDTYLVAEINEKNRSYKVAKDYKEYKKLVDSDAITMAVFGRDSCYYCNKFKPVYNAVANKYNLDIYFFDSDSYDKDEYVKILNMDLTVPAKCNQKGTEFKLSDGFGTPLTIFTEKGKIVDCISGYVNRDSLVQKLKTLKLISE